jgi:hypothetical protein
MEPRRFYLDTAKRAFVASPDATIPAPSNVFFREDVESIELYFLKPTNNAAQPYEFRNYSANTVNLAVGVTAPAALQTTWSSLSTAITPSVTVVTNGGSGANEVQRISFAGNAPVSGNFSITLPSRNVTVSSVSAGVFTATNHGLLNGQPVTLTAFSISGSTFANSGYVVIDRTKDTFKISTSAGGTAIAAAVTSGGGTATLDAITTPAIQEATASAIQQAFVEAGIVLDNAPQIIVTGDYSQGFLLSFANTQANINFSTVTVASTLASGAGLSAQVNFNTAQIASIISAGQASNCVLEIEVSGGGARQTYQQAASVAADIIASTSPTPVSANVSFVLQSPDASQWLVTIDNDGILTATKQ